MGLGLNKSDIYVYMLYVYTGIEKLSNCMADGVTQDFYC